MIKGDPSTMTPIQLTLPFTELIGSANAMLLFLDSDEDAKVVQDYVEDYLVRKFGIPPPESSEE
jgi:hypothetical protein